MPGCLSRKFRTLYGISPEMESSFCGKAYPDVAQRCAHDCAAMLGH